MRPDGKGGSVVFDGKNVGSQYQVYAARRDGGPWEAEVHALDSDVIYVQEGSATLVTGGTVVEPRNIEPNDPITDPIRTRIIDEMGVVTFLRSLSPTPAEHRDARHYHRQPRQLQRVHRLVES